MFGFARMGQSKKSRPGFISYHLVSVHIDLYHLKCFIQSVLLFLCRMLDLFLKYKEALCQKNVSSRQGGRQGQTQIGTTGST